MLAAVREYIANIARTFTRKRSARESEDSDEDTPALPVKRPRLDDSENFANSSVHMVLKHRMNSSKRNSSVRPVVDLTMNGTRPKNGQTSKVTYNQSKQKTVLEVKLNGEPSTSQVNDDVQYICETPPTHTVKYQCRATKKVSSSIPTKVQANKENSTKENVPATNGTVGLCPLSAKQSSTRSSGESNNFYGRSYLNPFRKKPQVYEAFRMDDKLRYKQLLQQYTNISVPLKRAVLPRTTGPPSTYDISSDSSCTSSFAGGALQKTLLKSDDTYTRRRAMEACKFSASTPSTSECRERQNSVISLSSSSDDKVTEELKTDSSDLRSRSQSIDTDVEIISVKPVARKNTLALQLQQSAVSNGTWLTDLQNKYSRRERELRRKKEEEELVIRIHTESRADIDKQFEERIRRSLRITEVILVEEEEPVLPPLTSDMEKKISAALRPGPGGEVLADAYRLRITRKDMATLAGLNWLNDEIINFYLTMVMERGKQTNYLSVYCCNTFFYPKLKNEGHSSLKRWTRKVDIFSHDLMIVPVHLGMHWCLAVVDFRSSTIKYYDSMGGKNYPCLSALLTYLKEEKMDKKKENLDVSQWNLEVAEDIPQQMNGSDCGMFTCKYAEYLSRDREITFTQADMPYFRNRMIYEILTQKLIEP